MPATAIKGSSSCRNGANCKLAANWQQGGFMLLQKFSKYLAAASFALALVVLPVISGGSVAVAQDGRYRNGDYNRDRGYDDNRYYNDARYYDDHNHQRREHDDHQRHEREDLKQHKREERDDLNHHQRSERGGYNGDGRYLPNDGYYDDYRRSGSSGRRY